jgi:hypothetical protein
MFQIMWDLVGNIRNLGFNSEFEPGMASNKVKGEDDRRG